MIAALSVSYVKPCRLEKERGAIGLLAVRGRRWHHARSTEPSSREPAHLIMASEVIHSLTFGDLRTQTDSHLDAVTVFIHRYMKQMVYHNVIVKVSWNVFMPLLPRQVLESSRKGTIPMGSFVVPGGIENASRSSFHLIWKKNIVDHSPSGSIYITIGSLSDANMFDHLIQADSGVDGWPLAIQS
jgi:hypothetical protein